jgi:gamma-glutamylcyclotransferase (GGCT)/AIG2-like uncharacterized protein YtfP
MTTPKLYVAYGSNLNVRQMAHRCPKARMIGATELRDVRLVFRSVADVEIHKGATCPVGVWEITADCERALDRYEGVSGGLYRKERVAFDDGDTALLYVMNSTGLMVPSEYYLNAIREGYRDFGLDETALDAAVEHARRGKGSKDTARRYRERASKDPRHLRLA